jgi:hypothetical protein
MGAGFKFKRKQRNDVFPSMKTYTVDELFSDIPGDPGNVLLTIPPEILESVCWEVGDTLNIRTEDGKIIIRKNHE